MKLKFIACSLLCLISSAGLADALPAAISPVNNSIPQDAVLINRAVAIVNNGIITQTDVDQGVIEAQLQITQSGMPLPNLLSLQRQVLHRLIVQKVILELADQRNITVDDNEVEAAISEVASRNNITVDQLKQALIAQGVAYDVYRQNIRNHLIANKLEQQMVVNTIAVSPEEVDNYLAAKTKLANPNTQYEVEHILLPLPNNPTAANIEKAKQQAEEIVKQINQGLAFTKAAMEYSQADDALEGGNLGWKAADQLPAIFTSPVQAMQIGQVYGPIQTDTGFHIIKLVDKRVPAAPSHFVTQYQVRDIMIKTSPIVSDSKAQDTLVTLKAQLDKGADFAALAAAHSQDLSSMSSGGNMGWLSDATVDPAFAKEMDNLALNTPSEPFKTAQGWYVIEVTAKRQQDDTQAYLRLQAQQDIFQSKAQAAVENWQNIALGDSYIKILIPDLTAAMNNSTDQAGAQ